MLVGILVAVLAVVLAVTGGLGIAGRLPGNSLLGVRTPETRRSPEAWLLANRAGGPGFLCAGVALGLGALALGTIGGWIGGIAVVVGLVVGVALLNLAGLAGSRVAAQWQAAQDDAADGGCCSSEGGCGDQAAVTPNGDPAGDPAAECGVTGGCGSCSLNGMCGPAHPSEPVHSEPARENATGSARPA